MKMIEFQGWKGNFYDSYFNNLDKGEWVRINLFMYLWLWLRDYRVRVKPKQRR